MKYVLFVCGHFPKGLDSDFVRSRGNAIERAIVACDDTCTLPHEVRSDLIPEYWSLPDPHEQPIEMVMQVRDLTKGKVYALLKELESG